MARIGLAKIGLIRMAKTGLAKVGLFPFRAPPFGAPPFGAPPFGAPPFGAPPLGAQFLWFGSSTLRARCFVLPYFHLVIETPIWTRHLKTLKLAKVRLAKVGHPNFGQSRSIKVGQSRSEFLGQSWFGQSRIGQSRSHPENTAYARSGVQVFRCSG